MAAAHGSANAESKVAFMYGNGKGVKQNHAEEIRWYLLAAAQDYAPALANLGFIYENGRCVEEDDAKALNFYTKAAKKGDVNAIKNKELLEARVAKQESGKH